MDITQTAAFYCISGAQGLENALDTREGGLFANGELLYLGRHIHT